MSTIALGVLVSGAGTNLQALLDAVRDGSLDAAVKLVLSNKAGVPALDRAARAGVPARVLSHRDFDGREAFDRALVAALREAGVELVVLAGFMRVLTPVFLDAFPDRVVNVHPALLPSFPGVEAVRQALAYGVKVTGCSVHFVDAGVDTGPVIAQAAVRVEDGDTEETLHARIQAREHALLVDAIRRIAGGRVRIVRDPSGGRPKVVGA